MNEKNYTACPLCLSQPIHAQDYAETDSSFISCRVCGDFIITEQAKTELEHDPETAKKLCGVTRRSTFLGNKPLEIQSTNIKSLISTAPHVADVQSKARSFLWLLSRKTTPAKSMGIDKHHDYPLAYATNVSEFDYIMNYIRELGWSQFEIPSAYESNHTIQATLTPSGWEVARGLGDIHSDQGFVAMWFNDEMFPIYKEAIFLAIENAGYRCRRIDGKDYNGDTIDEMLSEIRVSRFLVADVTGNRNGVYFEAGFAFGLGLPVIYTCRKDWLDKLHFDINHFNVINWETESDLKGLLRNRIEATIGRGKYNPDQA